MERAANRVQSESTHAALRVLVGVPLVPAQGLSRPEAMYIESAARGLLAVSIRLRQVPLLFKMARETAEDNP